MVIDPLLTKLKKLFGQDCCMDIELVLFCAFIEVDFVSVHKRVQTWPIPILTLVDNAYILQQITGTLEPGGLGESFVSS